MLAFFPWLRLRTPVVEGPFHLFPQGVGDVPPASVASTVTSETMVKLLGQYRDSANAPLRAVPVLQYDGRPLGADFDEGERRAIFRFGEHLAVSGMSDRRFIGGFPDDYTAAGHYQVVIQRFTEPYNGSISLTHRRKGGQANVFMGQSDAHFVRPAHLVSLCSMRPVRPGLSGKGDLAATEILATNRRTWRDPGTERGRAGTLHELRHALHQPTTVGRQPGSHRGASGAGERWAGEADDLPFVPPAGHDPDLNLGR